MAVFRTLCLIFLLSIIKGCHSQQDVCGIAPLNTRIVGGQNAVAGSWPWQVSLQDSQGHFCGGSLINNGWVLSAAHCFTKITASQVTVLLGMQSLVGDNSNKVTVTVRNIISHPNYSPTTNDNDIALLQLSNSVTFTNFVRPVCLAQGGSTFFTDLQTWVTGWGDINTGVPLASPKTLQEVQVPVVGNRKCNCLYGVGKITSNMICAGLLAGGKDSCQGDSGGPLVIKQGTLWIQIGVVSFGNQCALPNFPGVYTRVSQYQSWIDATIATNRPGFLTFTSPGTDADSSVSCTGLSAVATTTAPPTTTIPPVVCGRANLNNVTGLGNSLATAGQWPWMASLQRNGSHVCGGTLIAEQFVMSSADCFNNSTNASDWTVILGRLKQQGSNPNEASFKVLSITFSSTTSNNVAILKLTTKPTLSNFIQPICVDLGTNSFNVNTQCWAAGWGSGGGAEQTLQQFNTTVVSCGNSTSSDSICTVAMPLEESHKGGPLMCKVKSAWFQAAVLTIAASNSSSSNSSSNSTRSASPRATAVQTFTRTSSFSAFLSSVVGTFPITATSGASKVAFSFYSVTSVILLSLLTLIQLFSFE